MQRSGRRKGKPEESNDRRIDVDLPRNNPTVPGNPAVPMGRPRSPAFNTSTYDLFVPFRFAGPRMNPTTVPWRRGCVDGCSKDPALAEGGNLLEVPLNATSMRHRRSTPLPNPAKPGLGTVTPFRGNLIWRYDCMGQRHGSHGMILEYWMECSLLLDRSRAQARARRFFWGAHG